MSTLLLRLAGPMQSWGTDSKFEERRTNREPSKSGVLGLVAAAMGIRRQEKEKLRELTELKFGVIVNREGVMMRDFHTARPEKGSPYVTYRYYLADAVFVVGLESDNPDLLDKISLALQAPAFPLFLGRRCCPPVGRLLLGISDKPLKEALESQRTDASTRLVMDADEGEQGSIVHDVPVSFDPVRREYAYRRVNEIILTSNVEHDPMAELEG